jgi:hypothetical protein
MLWLGDPGPTRRATLMATTDERLDDLIIKVDKGFERTRDDARELRSQIGDDRRQLSRKVGDVQFGLILGFFVLVVAIAFSASAVVSALD